MEEHRQAERLQRQLQQEQAYLLSLQHDHRRQQQQQERNKQNYHPPESKSHYEPTDRPREVNLTQCFKIWVSFFSFAITMMPNVRNGVEIGQYCKWKDLT